MVLISKSSSKAVTPRTVAVSRSASLSSASLNAAQGMAVLSAFVVVAKARRAPVDRWNKLFHLDCQLVITNAAGEYRELCGLALYFNSAGLDFASIFSSERPFPVLSGLQIARYDPAVGLHGEGYHFVSEVASLKHIGHYDPDWVEGVVEEDEEDEADQGDAGSDGERSGDALGGADGSNGLIADNAPDFTGYSMVSLAELASSATVVVSGMAHTPDTAKACFSVDAQLYLPDGLHVKADPASPPIPASPSPSDQGYSLAYKPVAPFLLAWPADKTFKKTPPLPHSGRYFTCLAALSGFTLESGGPIKLDRLVGKILQFTYLGASADRSGGRIVANTLDSPVSGTSKSIFNVNHKPPVSIVSPPAAQDPIPPPAAKRGRPAKGAAGPGGKKPKVVSEKAAGKKKADDGVEVGTTDGAP